MVASSSLLKCRHCEAHARTLYIFFNSRLSVHCAVCTEILLLFIPAHTTNLVEFLAIMEDHLVAKIVSMCILGGISLFLGILPIKIVEKFSLSDLDKKGSHTRTQLFLTALNSFGAGVILTTALTHMLPEVNEFLEVNEEEGTINTRG